ncbi:MAG: hypothetical protein QXZ09_08795, partial [Candidatus Methanomethylicaceae archaeon]
VVRFLNPQKVEKLLRKLRENPKFQEFEGKLHQKGKRIGKVRALLDETNKIAILGIASEGDEEKIVHQVRIKVKPDKDDEPEENAEPAIQATACGQATGEAVPMGARLHAQSYYEGEGAVVASYDPIEYEPQICISQWGYIYDCRSTSPKLRVDTNTTQMGTFVGLTAQWPVIIYNGGGGRLVGTATVSAPFELVSSESFDLGPGEPHEIVLRYTPIVEGETSGTPTVRTNQSTLPTAQVPVKVVAVRLETFLQMLSGLSQVTEANTIVPTPFGGIGFIGFRNIPAPDLASLVTRLTETYQNPAQSFRTLVEGWPAWLIFLRDYLISNAIDLLLGRILTAEGKQFSVLLFLDALVRLGDNLEAFPSNYNGLYNNDPNFRLIVESIRGALQRAAAQGGDQLYRAFGSTIDEAVQNIIRTLAEIFHRYPRGTQTYAQLESIFMQFGSVAAFALAGLAKLDPSLAFFHQVVNDLYDLMLSQQTAPWYGVGEDKPFWNSVSLVLVSLGAGVLSQADPAVWKEFKESLAALAVAGSMARQGAWNQGGWGIHGLRLISREGVKIDLIATTQIEGRYYIILTQVFHAVTGFDLFQFPSFMHYIRVFANDPIRVARALGLHSSSQSAIRNIVYQDGKVGAVVAVHTNNAQYAAATITNILGETNYCNGKCFAILIEVDNNGRVVSIRGFGISDEEARRIAERMGFKEGELAPWAHSTSSSDVINDKKSLIYVTEPKDPKYCQQCH